MSDTTSTGSARSGAPSPSGASSDAITAIPLRHPGRWIIAVVLVVILALFVYDAAVNRPTYDWPAVAKYLFDRRVSQAVLVTLELTVLSMIGAILIGGLVAVMRLSPNPVLRALAWVFVWIFRGTPVYVQLVFWGLLSTIYRSIDIGIPFTDAAVSWTTQDVLSVFWLAVIGLGLNEAAYMSEIARAGILSVDKGQDEAAVALGMTWGQTMRRIILPQAMRVIIPPTGNEVISMLKTTSLAVAVPLTTELYSRTRDISAETFNPIPLLIVASIWYLAITSVLMVGQYFLEKRFARSTRFIDVGGNPVAPTAAAGGGPVVTQTTDADGTANERGGA